MRIFYAKSTVLLAMATLMIGATGQAQSGDIGYSGFGHKSGNNAFLCSALGTFIPVVAGVAWWRFDDPRQKTRTYSTYSGQPYYQWSNYGDYYYENPDRTVPICLILSGLTIGPSLGYFYGGCTSRGVTGLIIRVGTGAVVGGVCWGLAEHSAGSGLEAAVAGVAVGTAGALIILSDAIYDLAKVKCNVEKNNAKRAQQSSPSVILLPKYFADSGASGLQLEVNF